jgi:hypothetical protein
VDGVKISLSGVPYLPKSIAKMGSKVLKLNNVSKAELAIWRRLTTTAMNCGVVLPLLIRNNFEKIDLNRFELSMMKLNLSDIKYSSWSAFDYFESKLHSFIHFFHNVSNEATWCNNFWYLLIQRCFYLYGDPVNYEIQFEYETKTYLNENT